MRTWLLTISVVIAACKGKDEASQEAIKAALVAPRVEVATVLAKEPGKPPYLLVVDDRGARVGAAATWAALDGGQIALTKEPGPVDQIERYLREDFALGRDPSETVARLDAPRGSLAHGDPPPPPPEEEALPDDGAEDSGGTGTAIALEDPQLARQRAIEQARAAGILGSAALGGGPAFVSLTSRAGPSEDGAPSRLADVEGTVVEDGRLEPLRTLILIAPAAKATRLIEVLRDTAGAIAVAHAGKIRPLRLQFATRERVPGRYWLEARVTMTSLVVEAVPDAPIEVADPKELAAALDKARTTRGADAGAPVDVLVDAGVDVQRMIDVVVALDVAGVRAIGLGAAPGADELARRGRRNPTALLGAPSSMGELDKATIRRLVRAAKANVLACYTTALAAKPELQGTVVARFRITPNGRVASATATGVDREVASCIAAVIEGLEFPRPNDGGSVQVSYPFTLQP